jgi:hypothetical protein
MSNHGEPGIFSAMLIHIMPPRRWRTQSLFAPKAISRPTRCHPSASDTSEAI